MHMISANDHQTVIAEYIRTKGVTRCPTACAVTTQSSVTDADRAALEEYRSERDRQRREKPRPALDYFGASTAPSDEGRRRLIAPRTWSTAAQ